MMTVPLNVLGYVSNNLNSKCGSGYYGWFSVWWSFVHTWSYDPNWGEGISYAWTPCNLRDLNEFSLQLLHWLYCFISWSVSCHFYETERIIPVSTFSFVSYYLFILSFQILSAYEAGAKIVKVSPVVYVLMRKLHLDRHVTDLYFYFLFYSCGRHVIIVPFALTYCLPQKAIHIKVNWIWLSCSFIIFNVYEPWMVWQFLLYHSLSITRPTQE